MIGIFGGTFDPIHYGHLRAALEVQEIFGLEQVRLVLSANPPLRQNPQAPVAIRLKMLEMAVDQQAGFVVDTREIGRPGASYMVHTLESLRQDFPDKPLLLFIGNDAFNNLQKWYEWQRMFDFAHVVVLTRPGYQIGELDGFYLDKLSRNQAELAAQLTGKLYFQTITQLDISATAIRKMLAEGKNPRYLLPDSVLIYINEHKFYKHA